MKKIQSIAILISLFLSVLLFNSCSEEPSYLSFPKSQLPMISFQGFKIPLFPTAQGQLNYAKSGFANPEEKKASFEILFHIFPEDRLECGNADLYLSYMNLGYDYRFATRQDYTNAIAAYHNVIKNFKEHPQILVTAYWYLGWIHCDLLKEKQLGIPFFWHIVKAYPAIETGISSPVPWVSLVYPLTIKGGQPATDKTKKQWASLALLEIIRHAAEKIEKFKAFDILWKDYQSTVSTGIAIKLLLCDKRYAQKVLPYIEKYLALNIANKYLACEIKDKAKEY
jgi:hypothetical protein